MVTGFLIQCYGLRECADMVTSLHLKHYESKLMAIALSALAKLSQTCQNAVFFLKNISRHSM